MAERELRAIVQGWLEQAATDDQRADEEFGADRRGNELPEWVANEQKRLARIRDARAALEAEARAAAAQEKKGSKPRGRPPGRPPGVSKVKTQRNFTDPEIRIMKGHDGFVQAYNAQAAVDAGSQVIVAQGVSNNGADAQQLKPIVVQINANTGRQAAELPGP